MKIINVILKVVLCLIIAMPIVGALGFFPKPTPDLYNSPEAFSFINALYNAGYILYINAIVFAVSIALIIANRIALASILVLPITVNIVAFHMFLDGGLLTGGAVLGNIMLAINVYFIWQNREQYRALWEKNAM